MFLKRNPSHCCAILNPRTWTPGLPRLCLVKWGNSTTCHLAPKIIPHLPQTRIITEITEELILVFSPQGCWLFGFFSQAKAGQPQQGWEIAALRQPPKSHRSSRARSAPRPSRPFPSRLQSTHLKCLYLTLAAETLLDQSRMTEPAHRQF